MAVLEDPDECPERRAEAEDVEDQRLDGNEDAAEHEEQQHEGGQRDQPGGEGQPVEQRRLGVDELGRVPADQDGERRRDVAHRFGQSFACGGERLDGGDDGEPGGVAAVEASGDRSGAGDLGRRGSCRSGRRPGRRRAAATTQLRSRSISSARAAGSPMSVRDDLERRASFDANRARMSSCTWRLDVLVGSTRSSGRPNWMRRNGRPSRSRSAVTPTAIGTGRRITHGGDAVPDALVDRLRVAGAATRSELTRSVRAPRAAPGGKTTAPTPARSATPMPA